MEETRAILAGEEPTKDSVNRVDDVPHGFKDWVKDNEYRIKTACSIPYFMQDNGTISNGNFVLKEFGKSINKQVMTDTEISEFELRRNLTKLMDARMEGYLNLSVDLDSISNDIELGEFEKAQSRITPLLTSVERHKARTTNDIRHIQDLADERKYGKAYVENVHKIEQALGIQRGKRMTFDEANFGKGNPNYLTGKYEYRNNCQCCSVVYEARIRGWNVIAAEYPRTTISGNIPQLIAKSSNRTLAFLDSNGKQPIEQHATGRSRQGLIKSVETLIGKEVGRYQISVSWSGGGGHRFCAEHTVDGKIFIYDPQTGKKYTSLTEYFKLNSLVLKRGIGVLRTDNLMFNPKYINGILVEAK